MYEVTIFQFNEQEVRTIRDEQGEPWFVAKDACDVLEIDKHRDAISRLDDDERGSVKVDTPGGPQNMAAISESGLYTLIIRSNKPQAKPFRRWVTHEVLPAIRKTGSYSMPGASQLDGGPDISWEEYTNLLQDKIDMLKIKIKQPRKHRTHIPYTDESKLEVIELHKKGYSQRQIAKKTDRSTALISMTVRDCCPEEN